MTNFRSIYTEKAVKFGSKKKRKYFCGTRVCVNTHTCKHTKTLTRKRV